MSQVTAERRQLLKAMLGAGVATMTPASLFAQAAASKVLRVAMTAADIPLTTGQASQGGEGTRFIGLTLYDGLINWDLSRSDVVSALRPGLATEWSVDSETKMLWTFKLRPNVKFHDGSAFDADAVIWNLDKLIKSDAPQYDAAQAAQGSQFFTSIESYRKIDAGTVQIKTKVPDAVFPYQISGIMYSSPSRWEEVGRDWGRFAQRPSGTGPFILERLVQRDRAELVKNANYWDPARIPKSDRLILLCMPDANTRVAALLSGQVDFVEAPAPDSVPRLRKSGMQIITNLYPHVWPYQLSVLEDSPFKDVRVRRAANLAIDRDGLVKLLGGLAIPAKGHVTAGHPWFGTPSFQIKYDPEDAKRLLREAGFGPDRPCKIKVMISTSGSGQMQPLPMNEFIQENLTAVGFEVEFEVLEWEALRGRRRAGAFAAENRGRHGLNNSWSFLEPDIGILGVTMDRLRPPAGYNWGGVNDPKLNQLGERAKVTFDPAEQNKILAEIHSYMVDQALWMWVVHDLNPRALGPKVKGFVQAQSWFQDLTPVYVET
jgi:peptide/nickel transport system substrate-binding protein